MNRRTLLLANAGLFQLGWFACVLGARQPWLLLMALACIGAHLRWVARARNEWRSLVYVAACGWGVDSALMHLGLFNFPDQQLLLPLWLAMLWLLFASTLGYSLNWSARPWWLASLVGAVGGPMSYFAGSRLADVGLPLGTWPSLLLIAMIWAVLLPVLHRLLRWQQRH